MLWLAGFSPMISNSIAIQPAQADEICVACPSPMGLSVSNQNGTAALLAWGTVPGANMYLVEVENGSGNPNFFKIATSVAGTSFTVNGLLPTMNYKFKVRARCGGDKSNWSASYNFNASTGSGGGTGGGSGCLTPSGTLTSNITNSSAKLNWNGVAGVSGYRVNIENASGNPNPLNLTFNLQSGTTNYTVTGLLPGKAYKWKVRSLCGTQTSSWSANKLFTTAP